MSIDARAAYASLLDAQAEAAQLPPGTDEWLDAAARAQEAWAVLVAVAHVVRVPRPADDIDEGTAA